MDLLVDAVSDYIYNYANFTGRSSRASYWYAVLGVGVPITVLLFLLQASSAGFVLVMLASLALVLPSFAVQVRRLHDTGRSGWQVLWTVLPFVGPIILLVLLAQPSSPAGESYGPYATSPRTAGRSGAAPTVAG